MADQLIIRGAREHNLKDVSLDLPRDALIVFTGLSGSGKSSLAFDTIFAEGQRRYVESLSAYARQFLGQMDKPDVDFIEGLSPAVSIDQKSTSRNPRSTVGTITEVYDYLRLLYARAGRPHCPVCGEPLSRQTPQEIVDRVLTMPEGVRFQVLAPIVRSRKGEYGELFLELQTKGYSRARVDGEVISLTEPPKLKKQEKHSIDVVVDRLSVKESAKRRLTDSVETALGSGRRPGRARAGRPARGRPEPRAPLLRGARLPERPPAARSTSSSHARSRSTRPTARARRAPVLAPAWRSIPSCSCPTPRRRWPTARSRRGPARTRPTTSAGWSRRWPTRSGSAPTWPGSDFRSRSAPRSCTGTPTRCTSATATGTAASGRTTRRTRA